MATILRKKVLTGRDYWEGGDSFAVDSGSKHGCRSQDTREDIISCWGSVWWQGNRRARLGHSMQASGSVQSSTCSEVK